MKIQIKIFFAVFIAILLSSCGLFDTRTPTPPDDDNSIFVPPTSTDIVIDNFLVAVNNKNLENYCRCFLDTFKFVPSADANINYPGLFDLWKITDERKYFLNLINTLGKLNKIELKLTNIQYETQSSDNVVLFANYYINLELSNEFDTKYAGKLSFTIILLQDGTWSIVRWEDFQSEESADKTFSELKSVFSN